MAVLAASLWDLRTEIDRRWPGRSRKVDGWYRPPNVGGKSEHHPDAKGMVHAIDITAAGILPMAIVDAVRQHKSVCWYVIWNRQIYSARRNFVPEYYGGKSPHTDHLHVSIHLTAYAENYRAGWGIATGSQEGIGVAPPLSEGLAASWDYQHSIGATADSFADMASYVDSVATLISNLRA